MAKYVKGATVGSSTLTATYGGVSRSINITITQGDGRVDTAPANANAVCGSGNYLCTSGSGTGTMMYRLGTSGNFSSTRPTTSGLAIGSYTLYYYAASNDNYTQSSTGSITVYVLCTAGTLGAASNPASQSWKSSGTYSFQLGVGSSTGSVTYPTSITVTKSGSSVTGWSCTSAGVVTVPSGTTCGSYTVTGNCTVAANGNYCAVGATSRTWTITLNKASNQITVSPTTRTIYDRSGYNTVTVTVSNYKGTVTASSSNTGKATVSKTNNGSFTVTYVAAGSATITFTDSGSCYTDSSATCSVTCAVDTVKSLSTSTSKSSISYNGTATISVSATYESGYSTDVTTSASYSTNPTGIVTIS